MRNCIEIDGMKVRALRIGNGLSQAELARIMGIRQAEISGYETMSRRGGIQMAKRLAEALQVDYRLFTKLKGF